MRGIRAEEHDIHIIRAVCPFCGNDQNHAEVENLADVEDRTPGQYTIAHCSACGFVFLSLRPTAESLHKCYGASYHIALNAAKGGLVRFLYRFRNTLRYRRLNKAAKTVPGAVLEIGCGSGQLLATLAAHWKETRFVGIDMSIRAPEGEPPNPRIKLIEGEFEKAALEGQFDLVVMIEVLEHLASPVDSLRHIESAMAPGGLLAGQLPNWDSPWRKMLPRHWAGLQIPRHQSYFDPASLKRTLESAGFIVEDIYLVYEPGDLSVSLCNWITDRLKLRTPPRSAWFYFPLVILCAPLVWLQTFLFRASGSMEFRARKP